MGLESILLCSPFLDYLMKMNAFIAQSKSCFIWMRQQNQPPHLIFPHGLPCYNSCKQSQSQKTSLGKKPIILLLSQVFELYNLQFHHYYRTILFLWIHCCTILQYWFRRIKVATLLSATNAMELSGVLDFIQGLQFTSFHFMKNINIWNQGKLS